MNKPLIAEMIDRFLCWKLPKDFSPDCGITFTPIPNASPVGTNLMNALQAKTMLEHVLECVLTPRPLDDWHHDIGPVLWWALPVVEPPYSGTPEDDDWPGYHTHWTPIIVPNHERSH